jgi:hypothetical protein
VALLAYPQLQQAWHHLRHGADENATYYEASLNARINYGVLYLGMIAFLAMMTYSIHNELGR